VEEEAGLRVVRNPNTSSVRRIARRTTVARRFALRFDSIPSSTGSPAKYISVSDIALWHCRDAIRIDSYLTRKVNASRVASRIGRREDHTPSGVGPRGPHGRESVLHSVTARSRSVSLSIRRPSRATCISRSRVLRARIPTSTAPLNRGVLGGDRR